MRLARGGVLAIACAIGCGRFGFGDGTHVDAAGDGTADGDGPPPDADCSQAAAMVSSGHFHTCMVRRDGSAWCWGSNVQSQLGDGTTTDSHVPTLVTGLDSGVASIAAGLDHTCALKTDGSVWCWGDNGHGQLGDASGMSHPTPVKLPTLGTSVRQLVTAQNNNCVIKQDASLWCWGDGTYGQLGNAMTNDASVPIMVPGMTSVVAVATSEHTCAGKSDGSLWCWGLGGNGQIGDGSTMQRTSPVQVWAAGTGVLVLATSPYHTCAIRTDHTTWCWGYNSNGETAHGDFTTQVPDPTQLVGFAGATVTAAIYHSCATATDGTAACWGWNRDGEVGDGSTTDRNAVVPVQPAIAGAVMVSAGGTYTVETGAHSCAVDTQGAVWCWGANAHGEFGDGTTNGSLVPVRVVNGC
jgi:alpha-tubulin suppressor-like RCC1 family protein